MVGTPLGGNILDDLNIAENLRSLFFQYPLYAFRPAEAFEEMVGELVVAGHHHATHFVLHPLAHWIEGGIFHKMGQQIGLDDKRLDQTGTLQRRIGIDLRHWAVGNQIMHQPGGAFIACQTTFRAQLLHAFIDGLFEWRRGCLQFVLYAVADANGLLPPPRPSPTALLSKINF